MSGTPEWLESLGLGQYTKIFEENAVSLDIVPKLTEAHLKDLGVKALGHRLLILEAARSISPADPDVKTTPQPTPQDSSVGDAERRHLTVMFCDLVGSTNLSERLDPEELRGVITDFQKTCSGVIKKFDGFIARYMGDGLLVYFGYPQAHEDDAERAVRAALATVEAVAGLRTLNDEALQVRVGIATGLVVAGDLVGEGASEERTVLGDTPNVAARLQGIAEPNSVMINDNAYRLIEGLFLCQDKGQQQIKGISEPVKVFRVLDESGVASRFEAATKHGMTPLIGREEEIGLLMRRWEQAKESEGQVVLLSAEPGVGKSRILNTFQKKIENELRNRVLWFCSVFYQNTALHPIIDQFERALRFEKYDGPKEKLDKVCEMAGRLGLAEDMIAIISHLLSIPLEEQTPVHELRPDELKARTLQAVIDIIEAMASQQPVLIAVEDIHWADPTTLELLGQLIDRLRGSRVLIVITFRSEFQPPWTSGPNITSYSLNHLSRRDSAAMVERVTGGKALPNDIVDQIIERTDGIPLFVEELTNNLLESGYLEDMGDCYVLSEPLPPLAIPESLQDSLMARLDHLESVKEIAQLGAVIGRSFSYELLAAISPLEGADLDKALDKLIDSGLVYRRGSPPDAKYQFKHALVQDAAYQSLLKSVRVQYHGNIARILSEQFHNEVIAEPELLAYHYTEAGLIEQATAYWQKAGEQAAARSANKEAVNHFTRALALLESLAESRGRYKQELALRLDIGPPLMTTKGFASPEVVDTYRRAWELCRSVGDSSQIFPATWGLWHSLNQTGRIDEACSLADELIAIGKRQQGSGLLLEAHHAAWTSCFAGRDLEEVRKHAQKGIALYNKDLHHIQTFRYGGHDPGVCCRFMSALANCLLGFPDQAQNLATDAIALAKQVDHPFSLALALSFCTSVYLLRREAQLVEKQSEVLLALCSEQGFSHFKPMAVMLRGWAWVAQGKSNEGISAMEEGLNAMRAAGIKRLSFQLCVMVEAYAWAGDMEKGMKTVDEAEHIVEATGERRWESEVLRLKGDLLSTNTCSDTPQAELAYNQAIKLARQQKARLFELRAAMGLARLWSSCSRMTEAHSVLAPVYSWFREGFDTADLRKAKAMLGQLA